MTRYTYPSSAFVGFERLFDELNKAAYTGQPKVYPPHNIVKKSDDAYAIEIAVAGIDPDKITITVKENNLAISYEPEKRDVEYVYHGISEKRFHKAFTLHDHVVVEGADVENGVLTVDLRVEIPEEKKARQIEIGKKKQFLQE